MVPFLFLQKLITQKTIILEFQNKSKEDAYKVIGMPLSYVKVPQYIETMYLYNNEWYYYKVEEKNYNYPFYLIDELLGSYLARTIDLKSISFTVAKVGHTFGIASKNFKREDTQYYFLKQLNLDYFQKSIPNFRNIESLKLQCIDEENQIIFINNLLKLFALDIYMLQRDRGSSNIQFQRLENGYFNLAPIYDYANCIDDVGVGSIHVPNAIMSLRHQTIVNLCKHYPKFREYLERLLDQKMTTTIDNICVDYHFNQNCFAYEQLKFHYQTKEEKQKQLLKQYLDDFKFSK